MVCNRITCATFYAILCTAAASVAGDTPFASSVIDFSPAPGSLVSNPQFDNDPGKAIGPPIGLGIRNGNANTVVTLGGFGGSITLRFDHTVMDDAANPLGLDAIVFGNAFWRGIPANPNLHWSECAHIELCRDLNDNDVPDGNEPWYVIPGSHIIDLQDQFETQTWDDDVSDSTYPPDNPAWIPPGQHGVWKTSAYRLPSDIFDVVVLDNPNGIGAELEGIYGYADYSPTLVLGDLDGDDVVDDGDITPQEFYTVPDDPFTVGIRPGSGGGDAFDIAWAVDRDTGESANLDGFDFIRITTAVNFVIPPPLNFGEVSAEVDAVADVAPGLMGDADADGDVDALDYSAFRGCVVDAAGSQVPTNCRVMDFDENDRLDLIDFGRLQAAFTG